MDGIFVLKTKFKKYALNVLFRYDVNLPFVCVLWNVVRHFPNLQGLFNAKT